jgi:hypothetical protein
MNTTQPGQRGGFRPGAGRPVGSKTQTARMVMREQLVAAYVEALGGTDRVGPIVMQDVERAVDLVLLAREMRAAVRQGTAKISDLTRLEGAADRAVRRLNLKPGAAAAAPADDAWGKFLADHHPAEGDG